MPTLSLVTAPTLEPVTLAEAQLHCRVEQTDDDALLGRLIQTAREHVEFVTRRALITQTWEWKLDRFPLSVAWELPLPNLISVDSITYVDWPGDLQTWATTEYLVRTYAGPRAQPGRVELGYRKVYPPTRAILDAVTVRFTAGYASTAANAVAACPAALKSAMLLLVGEMYERRTEVIVGSISQAVAVASANLMAPYVIRRS